MYLASHLRQPVLFCPGSLRCLVAARASRTLYFRRIETNLYDCVKGGPEEQQQKGPSTVNNALFVGSTADLTKLLKNGVPKEDK